MAITTSSPNNSGAFIQTTNVFDVNQLQDLNVTSPEFIQFLGRLLEALNNMALLLNMKDTGFYVTDREFVCGQSFFPNPSLSSQTPRNPTYRNAYRKVINFGALPATTAKSVAHGITCTANTTFTRIYAAASDTTGLNYIPISYASASGTANIELSVNSTNVTITTASDRSNFNICYVILEYLKS
jgi:hypothetical protein